MAEKLSAVTEVINWRTFSTAFRNSSFCEARNSKCLVQFPKRREVSFVLNSSL
jgi:hypothetical protein